MVQPIFLASQIESISTRADRTLKVVFSTQELSPQDAGRLFSLNQKMAYIGIKEEAFSNNDLDIVSQLQAAPNDIKQKTPSHRLRAILYVYWNEDNAGYPDFDSFYTHTMEMIIQHFKSKLDVLKIG
jgi:hypothetical protein